MAGGLRCWDISSRHQRLSALAFKHWPLTVQARRWSWPSWFSVSPSRPDVSCQQNMGHLDLLSSIWSLEQFPEASPPGNPLLDIEDVLCLVAQSCPTLCDPMDYRSSVHGDSPGKNTEEGCHASSRGSSQPRDQTQVSGIEGGFFTPGKPGDQILTMCLGFRDRDLNWNVTTSSTCCVIFNPKPVYYSVKWAYLTYMQKGCWKIIAEPWKTPGFLASGGEEFNPGSVTSLDHSELLCNSFIKL